MKELLEYLARGWSRARTRCEVNEVQEDDGSIVLELSVARGRLRQRDRPRRPDRLGAAHGDQDARRSRTSAACSSTSSTRSMLRWTGGWLRAGRVGSPHGLDGSFHVGEPQPAAARRLGATVAVAGRDAADHPPRRHRQRADPPPRGATTIARRRRRCAAQELLVARSEAPGARARRVVGGGPRGLRRPRRGPTGRHRPPAAGAAVVRGARGAARAGERGRSARAARQRRGARASTSSAARSRSTSSSSGRAVMEIDVFTLFPEAFAWFERSATSPTRSPQATGSATSTTATTRR